MSSSLFSSLLTPRRRVFISYHHGGDRYYYDEFSGLFADRYEVIQDNSVDRQIDSDNTEYVIRKIREDYIAGTSCTIVLCGAQTPWRKFVDWEIKATLDRQHGLIGINLPTNPLTTNNTCTVPDRLYDNIQSGYALWVQWKSLATDTNCLPRQIEFANTKSVGLIENWRPLRRRNG